MTALTGKEEYEDMKKLTLCLIFSAFMCAAAPPQTPKLSKDLANADPASNVRVIVQWNSAPDDAKEQKVLNRGGLVHSRLKGIRASVTTLSADAARDLSNDPEVAYIAPDRPVQAKLDYTAAAINASTAWNAGWNGAGIGVAVMDSGINGSDPNLSTSGLLGLGFSSSVVYTQDLVGGDGHDYYGHGQHVAGILASNGSSSNCLTCKRSFVGIAPGVKLLNFRVLDQKGEGTDSNVIAAIDQAIALKSTYNVRVINLSLGRPVYESYTQDPLCQAVEAAWKAGIVVVVAAGNDGRDDLFGEQGYGTINAPGDDPYVITVGAMKTEETYTRTDDLIASYSSKGPTQVDHIVKPDLVAPGNTVVSLRSSGSTLANQYPGNGVKNSYYQSGLLILQPTGTSSNFFTLSGTSMATPVVSGAAADLLQANPSLTPDQVKLLLMESAYKTFPSSSTVSDSTGTYTDYYDIFTVGAGYVDLAAALSKINSVPTGATAISPTAVYDPSTGNVTLSYDPSSIWGNRSIWGFQSIWGAQSLWGASVLAGDKCIWGFQSIWGAASLADERSFWGAQSIWGADSIWAFESLWGAQSIWGASNSVLIKGER